MAGSLSAPKRRQWWQTLLLPLCLLIILISGGTIVKSSLHPRVDGHGVSGQWRRALDGVVSPSTARAIEEDDVLRKHYTAVINVTAGAAGWLAERYPSMHLEEVRDLLNTHSAELALDPRSHQSGSEVGLEVRANPLAALFGLGGASGASGAGGGIFSGIGDAIKNGLSGVGAGLLGDVAGAGMFLGIGIGQGAASGLNLTTADMAKKVAAKVALSSGMNSTGLNPAIQNLGSGLTSTLVGSIDIKSLGGGASNIGPAVVGLATGIGNGAVTGLKIKNITMPMPMNNTNASIADIAGMFGFGLTSTVTGNIDLNALGSGAMADQVKQQIPAVVLGLAQGLGNGAVSGLKINQAMAPPNGTNVPDIAASFGFGLSQSVASNVDLSALGSGAGTQMMLMQMLPQAASGFGKGLGEGIPIGLGISPDMGMIPAQMMPNGSLDVSNAAENFAMGLTSRVLANGTLSKLMSMQSSGAGLLGGVDVSKAAGGFARGFLQGAGDSVIAMGGVQALLNGNTTTQTGPIVDTPVQFNDSVNGAAVGFGQGFGSQGVMVVKAIIGQAKIITQKRHIPALGDSVSTDIVTLEPRQTNIVVSEGGSTTFNLSTLLNAESISTVLQKGINVLTCEGVGGLGLIALGLVKSGTIPVDAQSTSNLGQFKDMLPKGVIHFTNEGNTYEIDTQQVLDGLNSGGLLTAANGVSINGTKAPAFAGFLVVHLLLGILIMLIILPLVLGAESARNIFLILRKPHHLTWVPKWMTITWFLIIAPSLVLILVFGFLVMGNAAHFRTAHGVLGLMTVVDGIIATGLQYAVKVYGSPPGESRTLVQTARNYNNQFLLALAAATSLTGFIDLSKIAVCLTQVVPFELAMAIGFGLASIYAVGSTITQFAVYLELRSARTKKKQMNQGAKASNFEFEEGKSGMKESVEVVR